MSGSIEVWVCRDKKPTDANGWHGVISAQNKPELIMVLFKDPDDGIYLSKEQVEQLGLEPGECKQATLTVNASLDARDGTTNSGGVENE